MDAPVSSGRWCVFCRKGVEAWHPWRSELEGSAFLLRLDWIGTNVDRFLCPHCSSTDRDRHLYLFFDRLRILQGLQGGAILHIAPEPRLSELFQHRQPSLYVKADLFPSDPSIAIIDVQRTQFPAATFDLVVCNHVLEHVADTITALREIRRILKVGGRLVCQTPFAARFSKTLEDPLLQTEADRLFFYGQHDHVRVFGVDIEQIIRQAGFVGRLVPHSDLLPNIDPELLGVNEKEPFFDFVADRHNHHRPPLSIVKPWQRVLNRFFNG